MRCSASNRVCSEAHSGRASLGTRSGFVVVAGRIRRPGLCVGRVERAGMAAKRCLRAGSALDLGVAVGQVGVEAR